MSATSSIRSEQRHLSDALNLHGSLDGRHWALFLKVPGRFSPLFKKIYIIIIILGAAAG